MTVSKCAVGTAMTVVGQPHSSGFVSGLASSKFSVSSGFPRLRTVVPLDTLGNGVNEVKNKNAQS